MSEVKRRRAIGVVFAVVFVDLLGFGIIIPILPLYAESFGASELIVGLLIASYSVMQFIAAPILGRLSDERGRRPVLLISLTGSTIAWTLFGLAEGLIVLFIARLVAGAMGGNIAAAQAYIADITPREDRAKGLGMLGAAFGLGFIFGPALGGLFSSPGVVSATSNLLPGLIPINQFSLPSFVAAGITGVNLFFAYLFLPETRSKEVHKESESRLTQLRKALKNDALRGLIISFFLVSLAFSGMESMFVLFTKDIYGFGTVANGYLLAYVGVIIAIVQGGIVGRLARIFSEVRIAVWGAGIEVLSLLALPFAPVIGDYLGFLQPLSNSFPSLTPALIALLLVLAGLAVGNGFTNVSLNTLVSATSSDETQGGAFGLTQSAGSLARAIGPGIAGALYAGLAYWSPFVIGGLLIIPVVGILMMMAVSDSSSV